MIQNKKTSEFVPNLSTLTNIFTIIKFIMY